MQASTLGPASVRDLTLAPRPLSVVVLGAGKIGRVIATMLADSGDYRVCLVDHDAHRLDGVPRGITVRAGDPTEPGTCAALLAGADAVMNALPFHAAIHVATVAARLGVHYFDLTEDVAATHAIRKLADEGLNGQKMAVVLVEQFYDFAAELADQYLVMERGEVIRRGRGADMEADGVRQLMSI